MVSLEQGSIVAGFGLISLWVWRLVVQGNRLTAIEVEMRELKLYLHEHAQREEGKLNTILDLVK